ASGEGPSSLEAGAAAAGEEIKDGGAASAESAGPEAEAAAAVSPASAPEAASGAARKIGAGAPKKESVRSLVLAALKEGNRTMPELEEVIRKAKGTVRGLYQQVQLALRKVDARKRAGGRFTISSREEEGDQPLDEPAAAPAPAEAVRQTSLLDDG